MKSIVFYTICLLFSFPHSTQAQQVNPTGTYVIKKVDGNVGEIRVKLVKNSKIAIAVFVVRPTAYDYGDFVGTILLKNNKAVYTGNGYDSSCKVYLTFTKTKLVVKQTSKLGRFQCNFGSSADITGVYQKISSKTLVIKDLTKSE